MFPVFAAWTFYHLVNNDEYLILDYEDQSSSHAEYGKLYWFVYEVWLFLWQGDHFWCWLRLSKTYWLHVSDDQNIT